MWQGDSEKALKDKEKKTTEKKNSSPLERPKKDSEKSVKTKKKKQPKTKETVKKQSSVEFLP